MRRHQRLGLDEHLYKAVQGRVQWATADMSGVSEKRVVIADRLNISVDEFRLLCRLLSGSRELGAEEVELVRRVAAGQPPTKPPAVVAVPRSARRDIIAEHSNDVVYVTTSGRSGAFHVLRDCSLLRRGQAAAATMGKEVWFVEAMRQPRAEFEGHDPCTGCVPNVGSAELLRSHPRRASSKQQVSPAFSPIKASARGPMPMSKGAAKRARARAEATRLGITVLELKARRRAASTSTAARRNGPR
jgi:hypothetical protein